MRRTDPVAPARYTNARMLENFIALMHEETCVGTGDSGDVAISAADPYARADQPLSIPPEPSATLSYIASKALQSPADAKKLSIVRRHKHS